MMEQLFTLQNLPVVALLALIAALALRADSSDAPTGLDSPQCTPVEFLEEGTK